MSWLANAQNEVGWGFFNHRDAFVSLNDLFDHLFGKESAPDSGPVEAALKEAIVARDGARVETVCRLGVNWQVRWPAPGKPPAGISSDGFITHPDGFTAHPVEVAVSPLVWAIQMAPSLVTLNALLEGGAEAVVGDDPNADPWRAVVRWGTPAMVERLVSARPEVSTLSAQISERGQHPWVYALEAGHRDRVSEWVKRAAVTGQRFRIEENGCEEIVRQLVKTGDRELVFLLWDLTDEDGLQVFAETVFDEGARLLFHRDMQGGISKQRGLRHRRVRGLVNWAIENGGADFEPAPNGLTTSQSTTLDNLSLLWWSRSGPLVRWLRRFPNPSANVVSRLLREPHPESRLRLVSGLWAACRAPNKHQETQKILSAFGHWMVLAAHEPVDRNSPTNARTRIKRWIACLRIMGGDSCVDVDGNTPLHHVFLALLERGHTKIPSEILRHAGARRVLGGAILGLERMGLRVDTPNHKGETPLSLARRAFPPVASMWEARSLAAKLSGAFCCQQREKSVSRPRL